MTDLMLGLASIGGLMAYATAGVVVSRKLMDKKVREGHNDVCVPAFLNAGVLYAVLLGFVVVAVWESYDAAKATVSDESANLVSLYRAATNLPDPSGAAVREMARDYGESLIKDEWPLQAAEGKPSVDSAQKFGALFRIFGNEKILPPAVKKEYPLSSQVLMQEIQSLSNLRSKRALEASEGLSIVMWYVLFTGATIIITLNCVIYMERLVPHIISAGLLGTLMGMTLYACALFNHPFKGVVAISAEPMEFALHKMDSIDKGN
jgi:hypothetical protein